MGFLLSPQFIKGQHYVITDFTHFSLHKTKCFSREKIEKGNGAEVLPFSTFTVKSENPLLVLRIMTSGIIALFSQVSAKAVFAFNELTWEFESQASKWSIGWSKCCFYPLLFNVSEEQHTWYLERHLCNMCH